MTRRANDEIYRQIQRLAVTGEPLPADEHHLAGILIRDRRWDHAPNAIIGKRRTLEGELGSGALKIVTIDDLHDGAAMLARYRMPSPLGTLTVRVEAQRPYEFRGVERAEQRTALALDFVTDGSVNSVLGGTMPFDDIMEQDTRAAWNEWGIQLHYENTEKGGRFAFELLPGFAETVTAHLAGIE